MPNTINYAELWSNKLRELYGQELTCDPLYHSNTDIQITGGKTIKIPTLSVSGYKDHTRASLGFNTGSYANAYETKTLDHDRDIEFSVDPMDVDETDSILSLANIHSRFEHTQAIPELDCYTYSKLFSDKTIVTLSAQAYFIGDVAPELPALSNGEVEVYGVKRRIFQGEKARNPDGTVNYTRLDLI